MTIGKRIFRSPNLLAVGAAAATLTLAAPQALAEQGGGDSVRCGSAAGSWNAPNGASVASRTPSGVVAAILGYLGENYSHIMVSHGSTLASHASMQTPRAYVFNSSDDHWVLQDIQKAGPGAATVNMGAVYTYLYSQNDGSPSIVDYVAGGSGGTTAANYLLNLPTCASITDGNCRKAIADPQGARDIIGFRVSGVTYRHSYGVYTFVEDFDVHNGNHLSSPHASLQCASFQAMALNKSGVATIQPHFYSNAAGVASAVQGLYDIIFEFAQSAGANAGTSNNLADELANCFIDYAQCGNQSSVPWQNFKASGTANSISPDRIRGLGAHAGVNSPWTGATQNVTWNQAGTVYGCWAEGLRDFSEPVTWSGTGGTPTPPSCTPSCTGDMCGQDDGCGNPCSSVDVNSCGVCGNAACGACDGIIAGNIGANTGSSLSFTIEGTDVAATLAGGNGDADLYVKLGSAPTTSSYDCRSWNSGNGESCNVTGTGTWHILLYAYATFDSATLTVDVTGCAGGGGGGCTPSCTGDMCGQADGCGGVCSSADSGTCGMCGNAACGGGGGCAVIDENNLTGAPSSQQFFTIDGTDVSVVMAGGSGDADLYVKLGSAPTTASYDCRPYLNGSNESCNLTGTGTWHIMVRAYNTISAVTLDASVASCGGGGGGGGGGGTCSSVAYSASSTSSAGYTDVQTVQYDVDLTAGTAYTFDACSSSDDTYLRLHSGGTQKAANDDGCASGYASKFTYTPTSSGVHVLSLGCYNNTACSATVAISAAANSCTLQ